MTARPRVIVVGAGLTGLATAWHLRESAEVTVFERDQRLGGIVHTSTFDGVAFDVGADAYLVRQPHAARLVRDLGLGAAAVAAAPPRVLVHDGTRTAPVPAGSVMGVPTRIGPLLRAPALTAAQRLRAAAGTLVGWRPPAADLDVSGLVARRYGRAVVDAWVEPLLGGVHAGRADRLSAEATLPQVFGARGRLRAPAGPPRSVFETVRGGLARVTTALADGLGTERVRTGSEVTAVVDGPAVKLGDGTRCSADVVVLAVPARAAARLLGEVAARTAVGLGGLRTASVATVALAYQGVAPPEATGLLVTRAAGLRVKALTFSTRKWPHLAAHPRVLVRASVGRVDEALPDDDEALAAEVDEEVARLLGARQTAHVRAVHRWTDALPQYEVGHPARVARLRATLADEAPGVLLAGAAYDGVGLAARCREAEVVAGAISPPPRA
jgi:protoporphyrinogen/coproporphyrinogen III oxidase